MYTIIDYKLRQLGIRLIGVVGLYLWTVIEGNRLMSSHFPLTRTNTRKYFWRTLIFNEHLYWIRFIPDKNKR